MRKPQTCQGTHGLDTKRGRGRSKAQTIYRDDSGENRDPDSGTISSGAAEIGAGAELLCVEEIRDEFDDTQKTRRTTY